MEFLAAGRHGDMAWMANNAEKRADPLKLWPDTKSIIVVSLNYGPSRDPLADHGKSQLGIVSCYAQGKDYHEIVKPKLVRIARALDERTATTSRVFVDTAPLMEKPLAQAAGLGWQGKHTNLVARNEGSWTFIGAILTSAELEPDVPEGDHCGSCKRCVDACPTDAFPAPYQLDAQRCIAYLTIEHKGHIPRDLRKPIANRIFGCDDCLAVCPWNKFARMAEEVRLHPRMETRNPTLSDLLMLDHDGFRERFKGTPVKRTGRDRFMRNVLIGAGNSGDVSLVPVVVVHLADPSTLVRAAAVWCLSNLLPTDEFLKLRAKHVFMEGDLAVLEEWDAGDRH
ncbi:MAG: epoxyqueuosine reductase [Pseudomonadota bacterium]